MDTHMTLPFDPLAVTQVSVELYQAAVTTADTEQLIRDYLCIWTSMPAEGYGDLKSLINEVRETIIAELRTRPGLHWRVFAPAVTDGSDLDVDQQL